MSPLYVLCDLRPVTFPNVYIYVNDLPNCLTIAECDMLANDTQIASASNDTKMPAETLNKDLVISLIG